MWWLDQDQTLRMKVPRNQKKISSFRNSKPDRRISGCTNLVQENKTRDQCSLLVIILLFYKLGPRSETDLSPPRPDQDESVTINNKYLDASVKCPGPHKSSLLMHEQNGWRDFAHLSPLLFSTFLLTSVCISLRSNISSWSICGSCGKWMWPWSNIRKWGNVADNISLWTWYFCINTNNCGLMVLLRPPFRS